MNRYRYGVQEILRFTKYMVLETELSEDEVIEILERAERSPMNETAEDIAIDLEKRGIKVIEPPDSDYSSPDDSEIEELDFAVLEDENHDK